MLFEGSSTEGKPHCTTFGTLEDEKCLMNLIMNTNLDYNIS